MQISPECSTCILIVSVNSQRVELVFWFLSQKYRKVYSQRVELSTALWSPSLELRETGEKKQYQSNTSTITCTS